MSTILTVSPAIKSDWSILVAQRKAAKAAERARIAAQEVETARERARAALLNRAATAQQTAVSERTSGKNFGAKDPQLALIALGCIELESDAVCLELTNVGLVVRKYCVRSLAKRLTWASEPGAAPPFVSIKAANMFAATAVRASCTTWRARWRRPIPRGPTPRRSPSGTIARRCSRTTSRRAALELWCTRTR